MASGSPTAAIVTGGANPSDGSQAVSEQFDGTTWTEVGDLAIGRNCGGNMSSGTGTSAGIVFGGSAPGGGATEEWTAADYQIKTVTTS